MSMVTFGKRKMADPVIISDSDSDDDNDDYMAASVKSEMSEPELGDNEPAVKKRKLRDAVKKSIPVIISDDDDDDDNDDDDDDDDDNDDDSDYEITIKVRKLSSQKIKTEKKPVKKEPKIQTKKTPIKKEPKIKTERKTVKKEPKIKTDKPKSETDNVDGNIPVKGEKVVKTETGGIKVRHASKPGDGHAVVWDAADVISGQLQIPDWSTRNVVRLLEEGCTIPFIARYRKEQTGSMEIEKIRDTCSVLEELRNVETKVSIVKAAIEAQGKMTPGLHISLSHAQTMAEVECLYAAFKPDSKGSLSQRAKALGLEPLANLYLEGRASPTDVNKYINTTEEGLSSEVKILQGVKHIIADVIHKHTDVMKYVRERCTQSSISLSSTKSKTKEFKTKPGEKPVCVDKYSGYFDWTMAIGRVQPHQIMAINRGESQKVLTVKVLIPEYLQRQVCQMCESCIKPRGYTTPVCYTILTESVEEAWTRLIQPQITRLVRSNLTKFAEKKSIEVFTSNLKNLLLTPPYKGRTILAIDPGFTNGCKTAVISETGQVLDTTVVYMHSSRANQYQERNKLQDLITKHKCDVVAIGNGQGCRETEKYVAKLIKDCFPSVKYCITSESGASFYSVSDEAKKDLPDLDHTLRGAVAIGRRLLDPLAEYVKVNPKNLGVGQYQHDISPTMLKSSLDSTVEECVSFVGVDINTCSQCLLSRVSGLSAARAKNILEYRDVNGPFVCREQLLQVKGLGAKTYEQAAGFIRVYCQGQEQSKTPIAKKPVVKKKTSKKKGKEDFSANKLDMTLIHPEAYETTLRLMTEIGASYHELGQKDFINKVKQYLRTHSLSQISETMGCGLPTVTLITEALVMPLSWDFRDKFEKPMFRSSTSSIKDLKIGEKVTGSVTNVTNFGAFVDIGIEQNGLIHNSLMMDNNHVFFSSPFGGMEEEREELTRRYFPQIHHLCNKHGLQFAAVDMRWGITSESSENAQVINICLKEIDRSDMFIGFFGQRYGWHGATDEILQGNFNNAVGHYHWLDSYRDKSVTELEFLHGFLNNPGHLPAAMFFRDKAYDDVMREEGLTKGDKKQVFKYSAESELSSQLMDNLKHRISEHRDQSLGVHMDYKTPAEAAKIMFTIIMDYLEGTLLSNVQYKKPSRQEELLAQHDAFLASRCNIYVHGEQYLKQLNTILLSDGDHRALVTGDAGSGKSALLCNWITSLKQDSSIALVYHFVGSANGSADVNLILQRLVEEFECMYTRLVDGGAVSSTSPGAGRLDRDEQTRELIHTLVSVVDKVASVGKTPVLMIDGLDKVKTESKISKVLFWLPSNLPASCMVALSTLSSNSGDVDELTTRGYSLIQIQPLPEDMQRDMCVQSLQESGKELSPHQLDRIVAADLTKIPLFLKITVSELVSFGYFRLLDKKIDSLITSTSVTDLFGKVILRLEEDYNVADYHGNLVEQVLCCIKLSNQGLSEFEIKSLFDIPDHAWSPLYFAIEKLIVYKSGRIHYGFTELINAVVEKYLCDEQKRTFYLRKLVDYFNKQLNEFEFEHATLDRNMCRAVLELPWLLQDLGDTEALIDCLSHYVVFTQLNKHNKYDLVSLWQQTGVSGDTMVDRLLQTFDNEVAKLYTDMEEKYLLDTWQTPGLSIEHFLQHVHTFLDVLNLDGPRERVLKRDISVLTAGLQHSVVYDRANIEEMLMVAQYKLACVYCQTYNRYQEGIDLHKHNLAQYERQREGLQETSGSLASIGHYYHGIGVGYGALNQYQQAIEYYEKSKGIHERSGLAEAKKDIAASDSAIGTAYMALQDYETAERYLDTSIQAYEEVYYGSLPPIVGEVLHNKAVVLRKMDRMDEAEQMYLKSLKIKINAVGKEHSIVAISYLNLGAFESYRGNKEKAVNYTEIALKIFETIGEADYSFPTYVMAKENWLGYLSALQRYEEVDRDIMELLAWRVEERNMDSCLPVLYREMAKYYVRTSQFDKVYRVTHALLDSIHKDEPVTYILMDMALQGLPADVRTNLPARFTVAAAIEDSPGDVSLIKHYIETNLVRAGDVDEIARLINRLHELSDQGCQVYVLTCPWCVLDGQVQETCQQRIIQEGLNRYPDNLDLLLEMSKSYRREQQFDLATKYAVKVADSQPDNHGLVFYTAQTAAIGADFDTCEKYCKQLLDSNPGEEMIERVKQLQLLVEEAKQSMQQQTDPQTNQQA